MDRYQYTYERTGNYCYPDSNTLINKLNLHDEALLNKYERELVSIRQAELIKNPIAGNFDFNHLKDIHKYLFQDVYYWAGDIRNCNIAKMDLFCLVPYIDSYAQDIFDDLRKQRFYIDYDQKELLDALVELFGNINALHPFREGNGRTQRYFINMIARINGIDIDFKNISSSEMIEASHEINSGNSALMKEIFSKCVDFLSIDSRLSYIQTYISNNQLKELFTNKAIQNS